jgi:phosphatidylinositol alpha-1,6-mannosyltransferase
VPTTLIITNDFPPRTGGIESFVADVVTLLDSDVAVYTSSTPGSAGSDRTLGIEVVRGAPVLLPTPAATRRAVDLLRSSGATRVLFGAAAPLGLMAPSLRRAGATRIVALSHGHETWWASLPGSRSLLRRLADDVDHLSTISRYTESRIAPALSPAARSRLIRLAPPVDVSLFQPPVPAPPVPAPPVPAPARQRPRVVSVGRLVRQKGFDSLLRAWRWVIEDWPADPLPELVLVGDGPRRRSLAAMADDLDLGSTVTMAGAMSRSAVVGELQRADVFALLMRTRLAGLYPEGLGLAAIEAAACGLPVVIGDSGGAPETVQPGRTGFVVDPRDERAVAAHLGRLLRDRDLARSMGAHGRAFVTDAFGADHARRVLRTALDLADDG